MLYKLPTITMLLTLSTNIFSAEFILKREFCDQQTLQQKPCALTCINIIYHANESLLTMGKTFNMVAVPLFSKPTTKNPSRKVIIGIETKKALHNYLQKKLLFTDPFNPNDFEIAYNGYEVHDNEIVECHRTFAFVKGPLLKLNIEK